MSDISKHLGDERRLKLSIDKIKEVISKSTPVVNWYAHTEDKTVRGPFGRWFTASGEDKHLASINNDVEYCAMAMTVLPELVKEIQQLKQQLEDAVEVIEFYGDKDTYEYITSKSLIMNIKENCIGEDVGNKARQFLAKYRGEK